MRHLIVIEKTNTGYSAYSLELSGCAATGKTEVEVTQNMQEAIAFHFESLQLERLEISLLEKQKKEVIASSNSLKVISALK